MPSNEENFWSQNTQLVLIEIDKETSMNNLEM